MTAASSHVYLTGAEALAQLQRCEVAASVRLRPGCAEQLLACISAHHEGMELAPRRVVLDGHGCHVCRIDGGLEVKVQLRVHQLGACLAPQQQQQVR